MPAGDHSAEAARHVEADPAFVARGGKWDVAMTPSLYKSFRKFPLATRIALEELMKIFCDVGPENMPATQLNVEGRHPRGDGKEVLIRGFKDGCYRVYGGRVNVGGRPTFVCTAYDDNKKRRGADQGILARAAKNLRPYFERFGEAATESQQEKATSGAREVDADEKGKRSQGGKGSRQRKKGRKGRRGS
jgi:hypothetical protein